MADLDLKLGIMVLTFMQVLLGQVALALIHQQHAHIHPAHTDPESVAQLNLRSLLLDSRELTCLTETANLTVTVQVTRGAQSTPTPIFDNVDVVSAITTANPTATVVILPSLTDKSPQTSGLILSILETAGKATSCPLMSDRIPVPKTLIKSISPATSLAPTPAAPMPSGDIFTKPIATGAPPRSITVRNDHPVPRKGIVSRPPLQTNKFYSNFFLGDQTAPTYTYPYGIAWGAGRGAAASFGMTISHVDANQRVFGPTNSAGAASYFINPVGIQSMVISAQELGPDTAVGIDNITSFSATVRLKANAQALPAISFPLVQGMPFITAQYAGATPFIQTGVFFKTVTHVTHDPKTGVAKYTFQLEDGKTWRLYAYATSGPRLELHVVNNGLVRSKQPFHGIVQVAKDPGNGEALLDKAAGVYPTTVELTGSVSGATGSYSFKFAKEGHPGGVLVMYALPHHVSSFDSTTRSAIQPVQMMTPTKGMATAVLAERWTMTETRMPINMGFAPWTAERGSLTVLSDKARAVIRRIAAQEVSQDMMAQCDLDSMYFSGKALAKFALIIVVIHDILRDPALAQSGLNKLKAVFTKFTTNRQKFPLVYDGAWGGVVSSATYVTGDDGVDFGNTLYNDHHFHYGYHILAAAAIAHLDPSWLKENEEYVKMLVRDVANPSTKDTYFPTWRAFDWFHGHSWAHGLFASYDGKDQESSSEDMMHAYALKMWGEVSGDGMLSMRSNLQLSIIARALQQYYLYKSDNVVEPGQFIGNKVAGILFENKIDHTTYFGTNIEFIQGIHMIPLLPPSPLVRTPAFVREEWDVYFSRGRVDGISGGWKGIIYGNLATIDGKAAWEFFNSSNFDPGWIDGGASLTWYLTYAALMGNI